MWRLIAWRRREAAIDSNDAMVEEVAVEVEEVDASASEGPLRIVSS